MLLGADGVQIGSAFAVSQESSASQAFKQKVIDIGEGETMLSLKKLAPVRLIKNEFYETISQAEANGATADDLSLLLGNGRAKKGIFEGDIVNGELEIGQISSIISRIQSTSTIFNKLLNEYQIALSEINNNSKYHFTL